MNKITEDQFIQKLKQNKDIKLISKFSGLNDEVVLLHIPTNREWKIVAQKIYYNPTRRPHWYRISKDEFIIKVNSVRDDIEILSDFISMKEKVFCNCKIHNITFNANPKSIIENKAVCPSCQKVKLIEHSRNKGHKEFVNRLHDINPNIEIIGEYKNSKTPISCKCKKDGFEWEALPCNLTHSKHPTGCPVCNHGWSAIMIGVNDLHTTHPQIANMLLDKNLGYTVSKGTETRCDWICPSCKSIVKNKSIYQVVNFGLACPFCSDNISYSEKFAISLLNQLNIEYEIHKTFSWSDRKEYDFYIPNYFDDNPCILEMHGEQHYKNIFKGRKIKNQEENDNYKMKMAQENGIDNYFQINCFYSNIDWVKNNIVSSGFLSADKIDMVNWDECDRYALYNSDVVKTCELYNANLEVKDIANKLQHSIPTIKKYLKRGTIIGLCNYAC